jgi:hypothetical protein
MLAIFEDKMNKSFFGELKRIALSTLLITIAVLIAVTSLIAGIEIYCVNDSYYWMPLYPGAELLETQQQGYFRMRGMGITEQTYFSTAAVTEIRNWYRDYRREITEGQQNANPDAAIEGFGINTVSVIAADDGTGSIITYYTQCGQ